jgi:hypothetical protein
MFGSQSPTMPLSSSVNPCPKSNLTPADSNAFITPSDLRSEERATRVSKTIIPKCHVELNRIPLTFDAFIADIMSRANACSSGPQSSTLLSLQRAFLRHVRRRKLTTFVREKGASRQLLFQFPLLKAASKMKVASVGRYAVALGLGAGCGRATSQIKVVNRIDLSALVSASLLWCIDCGKAVACAQAGFSAAGASLGGGAPGSSMQSSNAAPLFRTLFTRV